MNGREFIKKVKKLGRDRGVAVREERRRGKGSHLTLYYGNSLTIVPDRKKELKTGTLHAILDQLGLDKSDLD